MQMVGEKERRTPPYFVVDHGTWSVWRRGWDSNPRYGFPYTRFPSGRLKPLGHPSGASGLYCVVEAKQVKLPASFNAVAQRADAV
jgi:hypothetical protein